MSHKEEIWLPEELKRDLEELAKAKYPEEACALLIGKRKNEVFEIKRIKSVENVWPKKEERKRRYHIEPKEFLLAEREAEALGFEVIGIFHSHPDYPAFPSSFDAEVGWEGYLYLIGRVEKEGLKELRAFFFKEKKGFKEVNLKIFSEEVGNVC